MQISLFRKIQISTEFFIPYFCKMNRIEMHYEKMSSAIDFIRKNSVLQPDLETISKFVGMSPFHFQRVFSEWTGVSPKKFLQFINLENAKTILDRKKVPIDSVSEDIGFSSVSRLHDLFVGIEQMTPAEYRNGGNGLKINYFFVDTVFGRSLMAFTEKGLCEMAFVDNEESSKKVMFDKFPNAVFKEHYDDRINDVLEILKPDKEIDSKLMLHLRGTDFQLKVWKALLRIPFSELVTYADVSKSIGSPNAQRAVGTAIGTNPIAFVIPCHRVIRSGGEFGNYMWGAERKKFMFAFEQAYGKEIENV